MSLQPLNQVLGGLKTHYKRRDPHSIQTVLHYWAATVGTVVAAQAQPVALYRGVLNVATSSAAWAQNLVFERQRILDKLNLALPFQLTDIRFSSAQWGQTPTIATFPGAEAQTALWQEHPSRLDSAPRPVRSLAERTTDTHAAFQEWANWVRSRDRALPLCPQCHCPTPEGELNRWRVCSLCISQKW